MGRGLAYLKLNNSSCMKIQKGNNINYMAGIFIPLEKLLQETIKKEKWLYKLLGEVNWAGAKESVESSFSGGRLGRGQVRFSSDF